jgi:hypothetical protein
MRQSLYIDSSFERLKRPNLGMGIRQRLTGGRSGEGFGS